MAKAGAISIEDLDKRLRRSSKLLDACATAIRDLELNSEDNIRRIGEALASIFEIQNQIYELRPDLTPGYLKTGGGQP